MTKEHLPSDQPSESVREMLSGTGYSDKAIEYFLDKPHMGCLSDADHITELTGKCGDTMKVYLKLDGERIEDAKFQVLGCPGAVASAMAAVDLIKGKTLEESLRINDREIYLELKAIPEQKVHCIRLAVKTIQKAVAEYMENRQPDRPKGEVPHAAF